MDKKIQRSFVLGDNWLYYKIYTGPKTSDIILSEIIKPLAIQLEKDNVIDKWFFIRYSDPEYHLRVRLHYSNPKNIAEIVIAFNTHFKKFIKDDLLWKVQTDTYQREIERYGMNTMEISEELFHIESKMVVSFIDMIEGVEGEELRWLFSLRAIDSFLNSFNYTNVDKKDLLINLSVNFRNEFGSSKFLGKQLNNKFRAERKKIETFMTFKKEDNFDYHPILEVIKRREVDIRSIAIKILEFNEKNQLQVNLNNLLSSYIHMFMNRLFKSKNRFHEMVCYDFLCRYYKSLLARKQ